MSTKPNSLGHSMLASQFHRLGQSGNAQTILTHWLAFQINRGGSDSTVVRRKSNAEKSRNQTRGLSVLETLLIFLCFALFAGQLPPDVNESHYLTKAKHFWNPEWCAGDIFLGSSFAHWLFYFGFGWITKFVSLSAFAWIGRVITWIMLAAAWRSTSWRLIPIPFMATISAVFFLLLNERFHLAGEWVVGGFEAKGIAYVFVILAMGSMISDRWKFVWPLLGVAAMFHVLVGGWAMLAAGFSWLVNHWPAHSRAGFQFATARGQFVSFSIGIGLLALGAIPPLLANLDASIESIAAANLIYVNQRIAHHLTFSGFPTMHVARFTLLTAFWIVLFRWSTAQFPAGKRKLRVLFCFGLGSLLISLGGLILSGLAESNPRLATTSTGLLRFYWFRLADFNIPATAALVTATLMGQWIVLDDNRGKRFCALVCTFAILSAAALLVFEKYADPRPVADRRSLPTYEDNEIRTQQTYLNWRTVCRWINENTHPNAVFITPYEQQTFKWYTGRTEVVNWKDIPQDAEGIVDWSRRVSELLEPQKQAECGLMLYSDQQLLAFAKRYGADYLLISQHQVNLSPQPTNLRRVYPQDGNQKATYFVFELNGKPEDQPAKANE